MLFTDFLQEWLKSKKISVKASTYDGYSIIVRVHFLPFFAPLGLEVSEVTHAHIEDYVIQKMQTMSANTVRKHLINLNQCFKRAVKSDYCRINPVVYVDKPRVVAYRGAKFLDLDGMKRLLTAVRGHKLEFLIFVTLFYGLRRSEVLGLKWGAIDFEKKVLVISHSVVQIDKSIHRLDEVKTKGSYRLFPIPPMIEEKLKAMSSGKALDDYVFCHADGTPFAPNYVTFTFRKLLLRNGLERIRFHDLRHSSASFLLSLGFDMKQIQVWLGHENISTTMNIYAHLDMRAKNEITSKLDEVFSEVFGSD